MKTEPELTGNLDFITAYATYLLGSGVHTSRTIRNAQRIGAIFVYVGDEVSIDVNVNLHTLELVQAGRGLDFSANSQSACGASTWASRPCRPRFTGAD